jgi:photosystem II stability/assembly factor-like uncharacterized protein
MKTRSFLFCIGIMLNALITSAQWVKTNGPEGISIECFYNYGAVVLCGTYAQGVYRSTNNGSSWTASNQGIQNRRVSCFTNDANYLYAGCFGEGVFRSSDNGLTWQPANTGIQAESISSLLSAGGYLFAGTVMHGVYRSADHGNTWVAVNGGVLNSSYIKAMVYRNSRLMVSESSYIFYSTDAGNSWNVDQGSTQFYSIYHFLQKGDTIWAASFNTVFTSTDGGLSWSNPVYLGHSVVGLARSGNTVYAGTLAGVYSSNNWGQSWSLIPATGLRPGASSFTISGTNFIMGREEIGIAISANAGTSWTELPLIQFARASTIDNSMICYNDTLYTGTHGNGVFRSVDHGNNWTKIGTTNQFDSLSNDIVFSLLKIPPNIILAGGGWKGLFRSANNGASWTHITGGLPYQGNPPSTNIPTLAKCGNNIIAATTQGVYYSTDQGLNWTPTNMTGQYVLSSGGLAVKGNNAWVGIIGLSPVPSGVYKSTDNGVSWMLSDPLLDIDVMAAGGGNTLYCGGLFSAWVSHNDGLSWNGTGLGAAFTILAWDKYVFIGNNNGVFFSNDSGNTWTPKSQGMDPYPNNAVQGLTRDNNYVYAGMFRDAIWRRPLSDFGIPVTVNVPETIAEKISIAPNPATALVNISLPSFIKEDYTLIIYNAAGQKIFTHRQQVRNQKSISVYVKDYPAGHYTLVIKSGSKNLRGGFLKTN